jgi:hypothetical protein
MARIELMNASASFLMTRREMLSLAGGGGRAVTVGDRIAVIYTK